jgi:hypothetical protein
MSKKFRVKKKESKGFISKERDRDDALRWYPEASKTATVKHGWNEKKLDAQ